jgi:hypothetical protein
MSEQKQSVPNFFTVFWAKLTIIMIMKVGLVFHTMSLCYALCIILCMYMYKCIIIHTHTSTHKYQQPGYLSKTGCKIHSHVYTCLYVCIYTYIQYTRNILYVYTSMHVCMICSIHARCYFPWSQESNVYLHVYACSYLHVWANKSIIYKCMFVCALLLYTHVLCLVPHTCIFMYIYIHTYTMYVWICMHVCVYMSL